MEAEIDRADVDVMSREVWRETCQPWFFWAVTSKTVLQTGRIPSLRRPSLRRLVCSLRPEPYTILDHPTWSAALPTVAQMIIRNERLAHSPHAITFLW